MRFAPDSSTSYPRSSGGSDGRRLHGQSVEIPGFCGLAIFVLLSGVLALSSADAAGRVTLELLADERAPLTSQHEWAKSLAKAGVENVRFRVRLASDNVGIETVGTAGDPSYQVTGLITTSGDVVIVPGARFHPGEAARLARWLQELPQRGAGGDQAQPRGPFGLSPEDFDRIRKDLAQPLGFSTKDMDRLAAVRKAITLPAHPVSFSPGSLEGVESDKVAEDLSKLSCGTALAYLLRPAGLCLTIRTTRQGLNLVISAAKAGTEPWPVGWPPEKSDPEILPALYQSFGAQIERTPLTTLLTAVAGRLEAPILLDHNALARYGIEPDKVLIDYKSTDPTKPKRRVSYLTLLRYALGQAKLKSELRLDEAGHPFLWVTTLKPI